MTKRLRHGNLAALRYSRCTELHARRGAHGAFGHVAARRTKGIPHSSWRPPQSPACSLCPDSPRLTLTPSWCGATRPADVSGAPRNSPLQAPDTRLCTPHPSSLSHIQTSAGESRSGGGQVVAQTSVVDEASVLAKGKACAKNNCKKVYMSAFYRGSPKRGLPG